MKRAEARRHCQCGASYAGSGLPPAVVEVIAAKFDEVHSGDGHGPATAEQARRARARNDALEDA